MRPAASVAGMIFPPRSYTFTEVNVQGKEVGSTTITTCCLVSYHFWQAEYDSLPHIFHKQNPWLLRKIMNGVSSLHNATALNTHHLCQSRVEIKAYVRNNFREMEQEMKG